jgi:hypothetical protein
MYPVVGVFAVRADAERFVENVDAVGLGRDRLDVFVPSDPRMAEVPTTDAEQPGLGAAIGGVVGGATGAFAGLGVIGTLLLPGIGTITALGAGLIFGAAGAAGGALVGNALDRTLETGVPADEMFVYEDALRQGKTVVFVFAEDDAQAEVIERALRRYGAESVNAAREHWKIGTRDASSEEYDPKERP